VNQYQSMRPHEALNKGFNAGHLLLLAALVAVYGLWMQAGLYRTNFVFLACSYLLASVVFLKRGESLKTFFDPKVWFHHTTALEIVIISVTYIFMTYGLTQLLFLNAHVVSETLMTGFNSIGLSPLQDFPAVPAMAAFAVVSILAHEAAYYCAHRWMHTTPMLWEFHKVHHSAQVMTPFTSLRQHPVETFLMMAVNVVFVGFTSAIFLYFIPSATGVAFALQYSTLWILFCCLGGSLAHSHLWISYGPLDRLIISPAMHQIHHSQDPRHFDKNFSKMLTVFDYIGGSLYIPTQRENLTFGLGATENKGYYSIKDVYLSPFVRALRGTNR